MAETFDFFGGDAEPVGLSVKDAADIFSVSEKCIREWITAGLPTVKDGYKGPGQGALIDGTRARAWVRKHKGIMSNTLAEKFQREQMPCNGNILRWLVERFFTQSIGITARAVEMWAHEPRQDGVIASHALGLTKEQANEVGAQLWLHIALGMQALVTDAYDKALKDETGADLDSWASLLLDGDIRSTPTETFELPATMLAMMTPEMRSRLGA